MKHPELPPSPDRRDFLKRAAGAGLMVGAGPLLIGCGADGDGDAIPTASGEQRSYLFDLSKADPHADHFLVAGTHQHRLTPASPQLVTQLKAASVTLQSVSSQSITHVAEALVMPVTMQMCYVKSVPKAGTRKAGSWDMHMMFYHVPAAAAVKAARQMTQSCGKAAPTSLRPEYEACRSAAGRDSRPLSADTTALVANNSFCSGADFDNYKDYFDHAMALVCNHPEIGSFDAPTLSYVQQAIVCADANLVQLAVALFEQGPASTTPGGWATLVEYIDPATGLPKLASDGSILYFTQHSARTLQLTGTAINSILPKVKNDPMLGASVTGLSPADLNGGLQGKMWVTRAGTPTRLPATQALVSPPVLKGSGPALKLDAGAVSWAARDVSGGNGFSFHSVTGTDTRTVSFGVSNWYLRYLGLYVRFLDGAGNPIPRTSLPADTQLQFIASVSGTYDCFLSLVNQELVVLGIPVKQYSQTYSVVIPSSAASILIMAGGLGSGSNSYPETVSAGAVTTVVLDLAIPGLFLAMAAVSGYASLSVKLAASTQLLVKTAQVMVLAIADSALAGAYHDPAVFMNLVLPIATTLLKGAAALYAEVETSLAEGEAEGAAEDAIPFGIGLILQAVMAVATAAQISETSAEVANSPWTFITEVDATHDLAVTINHDPLDTQGFPATATSYMLRAVCDGGSPAESGRIAMQATTRTAPLAYTFRQLPSGGKVTVTVAFYSDNDWLAGAGSTGAMDNTLDTASITIKENLVPLSASTVYAHKQKIGLDAGGNHVWVAGRQPALQAPTCDNASGNLCILQSITVSETFGAVGYAWQAYSAGVVDFASGAPGQLYQFASLSFTDQPQSGWVHSGGGFRAPARLAYDRSSPVSQNFYIDSSQGRSVVRRITMTAVDVPPVIDLPGSNLSVGRFNFPSDAFLIHPAGKLISINAARGKLEVLVPSATPVADLAAPMAQAFSGPGTREGLLNGPVCAVVSPGGAILVLEQGGNRIQAFDTGANPTPLFAGSSTMPLKPQNGNVVYLDMAVEFIGYLYLLSRDSTTDVYSMDIYTRAGQLLATTSNMNVSKLTVDLFRNVFTLNFETLLPIGRLTEPSISQWIPSTP